MGNEILLTLLSPEGGVKTIQVKKKWYFVCVCVCLDAHNVRNPRQLLQLS